ncbi:MAG TPA: hypothetical protein VGM39_02590 [Kofleriaceae bacterium]|jgi:hypothetical protein
MRRAVVPVIACAIAAVAATPSDAHAYEFWLHTESIGQLYQLREYKLIGPDLFLGRRRYTQTLALRISDIGGLSATRREERLPDRGLRISWQSYLRIDHDFGTFTGGKLRTTMLSQRDAIDAIPELAESSAGLELLYANVTLEGIADDRVIINLGRVLDDDGWGATGIDGGRVRAELPGPAPLAITATAGLRVRDSSWLGASAFELDGTSGAGCQEYVEGATPGSGVWKLIDRNRNTLPENHLASDNVYCPQREVRQPTISVSLATARTRNWGAEIGYRRTWSDTVGIIDDPNRFQYTDVGLYPNEAGQAPSSGINEEHVFARAHANVKTGELGIAPYADARASLLHGALDRLDAGVRLEHGKNVIEPSIGYFLPTFDGDSIFNVFSIEPTRDARIAYTRDGAIRVRAEAWLRRYSHEDNTSSYSGGGEAGIEHPFGDRWRAQLSALYDDGYGGRRVGGTGDLAWKARADMWFASRLIALGVHPDDGSTAYVSTSAQLSSSFKLADQVGLHIVGEVDHDEIHDVSTRVFAIMDFAFLPEL